MRGLAILCLLAACSFKGANQGDDVPMIDAPPNADGPDAPPSAFDAEIDGAPLDEVAHLNANTEAMLTSTTPWMISASTSIDTTTGDISPSPPGGVIVLDDVAQTGAGPNVMVIQAGAIMISATVTVVGDKPLILVADNITVSAVFDVSAENDIPGPGGFLPGMGPGPGIGAGEPGDNGNNRSDSGGSGGSHGSRGGDGGNGDSITGEMSGTVYGTRDVLVGGAGGGEGSPSGCVLDGGAGGGALQLTAKLVLTITAAINAGGGGGQRGKNCGGGDGGSGGGGGAGGMIYLQSPSMLGGVAALGANGGGGGGGADDDGTPAGGPGLDAPSGLGGGGGTGGGEGGGGGGGASGTADGADGTDRSGTDDNGGGGGGGVGHIYYKTTGPPPPYSASPPAEGG
jgi:hypothetical protein